MKQLALEVRGILPVWAVALALAIAPALLGMASDTLAFGFMGLALGAVLVSVQVFGKEFTHRTWQWLLSQPIRRGRLWREKIFILSIALAALYLAFVIASYPKLGGTPGRWLLLAGLTVTSAFSGGVCWSLVFRQVHAAIWFSAFVPFTLGLMTDALTEKLFPDIDKIAALNTVLAIYSAAAFFLARRLFLRMEDASSLAGELELPIPFRALNLFDREKTRFRSNTVALLWKEMRLQQINFVLAGTIAAAFFLAAMLDGLMGTQLLSPHSVVWILFWFLWFLLPWLIGAASIAEERKLGVHGWHMTLPASRARQLRIKLMAVYSLSLGLGVLLPWSLDFIAHTLAWLSKEAGLSFFARWEYFTKTGDLYMIAWVPHSVLLALVTTTIGIYASSMTRNLLQSLSLGIGLAITGTSLLGLFVWVTRRLYDPPPVNLLMLLAIPVSIGLVLRLIHWNYQEVYLEARLFLKNFYHWAAALLLVIGLTGVIYGRFWEFFMPEVPEASVHQLPGNLPAKATGSSGNYVLLPDGTLMGWGYNIPAVDGGVHRLVDVHSPKVITPGVRWRDVSAGGNATAAIRADGTLWTWGFQWPRSRTPLRGPVQIGKDADWRSVSVAYGNTLALKQDGTLWGWGENRYGQLGDGTTNNRAAPVQIGRDKDWQTVSAGQASSAGIKRDGTLWAWGLDPAAVPWPVAKAQTRLSPKRISQDTNWTAVAVEYRFLLAIRADGSLWAWGSVPDFLLRQRPGVISRELIQVDSGPWKQVALSWRSLVGIRRDGSLWRWEERRIGPWASRPKQLGKKADWLAVDNTFGRFGLTADGEIWQWTPRDFGPHSRFIPTTRRPSLLADVAASSRRAGGDSP